MSSSCTQEIPDMWLSNDFLSYKLIPEKFFPVPMTWVAQIQLFAIQPGSAETQNLIAQRLSQGLASLTAGVLQQHTGHGVGAAFGKGNEHLEGSSRDILDSATTVDSGHRGL